MFWPMKANSRLGKQFGGRYLWQWINYVFNRVDSSRKKEVGADRAAAEWLIRCGASVKWKGYENWHTDYNTLQGGSKFKIEEIDASESCIMGVGFQHFDGLEHVKRLKLNRCASIYDEDLLKLAYLKATLQCLEITSCWSITDRGLFNITNLKKLKELHLSDLPSVKDLEGCAKLVQTELPDCHIHILHN